MTPAHAHLLVNHLPVFSTLIAVLVLCAGYIWHMRADAFRLGVLILLIGGAGSAASWATGEGAEEAVEPIAQVKTEAIHAHEEQAEAVGAFSIILAVVALGAGIVDTRTAGRKRRTLTLVLLLGSLAASVGLAKAGYSGGLIRHPEIDAGFDLKQADAEPGHVEEL